MEIITKESPTFLSEIFTSLALLAKAKQIQRKFKFVKNKEAINLERKRLSRTGKNN